MTQDSVLLSHFQTTRGSSKLRRCSSYLKFSSRCLEMCSNMVLSVLHITSLYRYVRLLLQMPVLFILASPLFKHGQQIMHVHKGIIVLVHCMFYILSALYSCLLT